MSYDGGGHAPVLRIVHGGTPTAEELAALAVAVRQVAVRDNRSGGGPADAGKRWPPRAEALRGSLPRRPGGWARSGRPHG